jgi:putative ABC transport system substrate-binding protein
MDASRSRAPLPRRLFLAALLTGALPSALSAPEARKRRLGFLGIGDAQTFLSGNRAALLEALARLGYVTGRDLEIEECYEKESPERLAECAQRLADRPVDVIVTEGTTTTLAAQRATRRIPIVTNVGDPVAAGFAHDLRRPGSNVTGLAQNRHEIARKQIELLRMMRPGVSAIAILWERPFPGVEIHMKPIIEAARDASIATHELPRNSNELVKSLGEMKRLRVDAAFTVGGAERQDLEAAVHQRVAIVSQSDGEVEEGSLFSIEPDLTEAPFHAATIIDKLLRGANAADVPFLSASRYRTTINAKTAKLLGIRLTPELLLRADRIVE